MILYFNFSHITLALFSEFVVNGHYYTSPNQQKQPPTVSFSDSEPLSDKISLSQLCKRVWAHHHSPYLPFVLKSPFNSPLTSRFATPLEDIPLEKDKHGYHLLIMLQSFGKPSNNHAIGLLLSFALHLNRTIPKSF